MQRSIIRTIFILGIVIIAAAFSNRSGKNVVKQGPKRVTFIEKYLWDFSFAKPD